MRCSLLGKWAQIIAGVMLVLFFVWQVVWQTVEAGIQTPLILHDTHDSFFRYPFGAVPAGEEVRLRIRAGAGDVEAATLSVWDQLKQIRMEKPMELVATSPCGIYEYWEIMLMGSYTPTILWYHFTLKAGERVIYYFDPGSDGGIGKAAPARTDSFQLTVYCGDFRTPDWIKTAVLYQIFPDRFYDGDPENNRLTGERGFRGDWPREWREWGQLPTNPREHGVNPDYEGDGIWNNCFFGGDLRGIINRLDHLQSLGVRALYLTPIFKAASNHKFDTADYRYIDQMFGTNEDFLELTAEARKRGIHLILDGVFNHVGDCSRYFDRYGNWPEDIGAYEYWSLVFSLMDQENLSQAEAEVRVRADFKARGLSDFTFTDWFEIENRRINIGQVGVYGGERFYYEGWYGFESLPAIRAPYGSEANLTTFVDYIIRDEDSIARRWVQKGSSGWRLDVSPEVCHDFWATFRQYLLARPFPHGRPIMIAENWFDASRDFLGFSFDSTMNYRFRGTLMEFVLGGNAETLDARLMEIYEDYPREAFYALMNLLGSHDKPRVLTVFGYIEPELWADRERVRGKSPQDIKAINELARRRVKMATILQFGYPGSPMIYYGDEIGLSGHMCPDNRRTMPWERVASGNNLLSHFRKVAAIRNENPVLMVGDRVTLYARGGTYVIGRRLLGDGDVLGQEEYVLNYYTGEIMRIVEHNAVAIIIVSREGEDRLRLDLSEFVRDGAVFIDLLNEGRTYTVREGALTLNISPLWGAMLIACHGPQDILPPAPPTGLVAQLKAQRVKLSWESALDAVSYNLYRTRIIGGHYELVAIGLTETSFFTNLGDKNYFYTITAVDAAGNESAMSAPVMIGKRAIN